MAAFFYPELDSRTVKNLLVVRQLVAEHAGYFLDSPYPQSLEADLNTLFKLTKREITAPSPTSQTDELDTEFELRTLYISLKNAKPGANDSDQLGYYRVSASLLEKLLSMLEKAKNIKTMSDHHSLVLEFLHDICSPTQITEFLKRLKEASL